MHLLKLAHESYEKRIRLCLGPVVIGETGSTLSKEALAYAIKEISWIPAQRLDNKKRVKITLLEQLKACVEDIMEETWDWWPLQARQPPLRPGLCRLWRGSPTDSRHHLDVPEHSQENFRTLFRSAPAFVDPSSLQTSQQDEAVPRGESPRLSLDALSHVSRNIIRIPSLRSVTDALGSCTKAILDGNSPANRAPLPSSGGSSSSSQLQNAPARNSSSSARQQGQLPQSSTG